MIPDTIEIIHQNGKDDQKKVLVFTAQIVCIYDLGKKGVTIELANKNNLFPTETYEEIKARLQPERIEILLDYFDWTGCRPSQLEALQRLKADIDKTILDETNPDPDA